MNEFARHGLADTYVEVSMDWQFGEESKIAWYFRNCVAENSVSKEWKKSIIEAFEITKDDLK
jgi:hypothetical protein